MNGKTLAVIIAVVLGGLLVAGIALSSCQKGTPAPASTSVVEVDEDDDSCWSVEELIERDEDCGYDKKSPKPVASKTTAPARPAATPPRPRNTRR